MPRNQLVHEWLEKARHDLDTAARELRFGGWPDIICFHGQQTVEKLLKAALMARGVDITRHRVHDLSHLLHVCLTHGLALSSLRAACQQLTGYYIAARYPTGARYTRADAQRAVVAARKAMIVVRRALDQ